MRPLLTALFVLVFSALGCASTQMKVELAIYDGKPTWQPMLTVEQVEAIQKALDELLASGQQLVEDREALAKDAFDAYEAYWQLLPDASSAHLEDLRKQLGAHLENLEASLPPFEKSVAKAEAAAEALPPLLGELETLEAKAAKEREDWGYRTKKRWRQEPLASELDRVTLALKEQESDLRRAISAAQQAAQSLSSPPKTNHALLSIWEAVRRSLGLETLIWLRSVRADRYGESPEQFVANLEVVRDRIETIAKRIVDISERYAGEGIVLPTMPPAAGDRSKLATLSRSLRSVVADASTITGSLDAGGKSAMVTLSRTSSLAFSQIDRLQDAGDPVWRRVSARENQHNWNTEFSETYFYAEGNASVVVVRDSPMAFRVQRGNNNPAALVRGQLTVSRSIADAAITIAGAAAGIPTGNLVSSAPVADDGTQSGTFARPTDDQIQASQTLAGRRAAASEAVRSRLVALRALDRNLADIRDRLEDANTDADRAVQVRRLRAVLQGLGARFAPAPPAAED